MLNFGADFRFCVIPLGYTLVHRLALGFLAMKLGTEAIFLQVTLIVMRVVGCIAPNNPRHVPFIQNFGQHMPV